MRLAARPCTRGALNEGIFCKHQSTLLLTEGVTLGTGEEGRTEADVARCEPSPDLLARRVVGARVGQAGVRD